MKNWLMRLLLALAVLAAPGARADVGCSLTANPAQVKGFYSFLQWGSVDLQGSFSVACTRDRKGDPNKPTLWIGVDEGAGGATATQEGGTSTLGFTVYHRAAGSGVWTNTGNGVPANSTNTGAVAESLNFTGGATASDQYDFYIRIPGFQWFRPAGVYQSILMVTVRLGDANRPVLSQIPLEVLISIPKDCRFSTPPTPIDISYTAFSTSAVTGASTFGLTCTQDTTYTMQLDVTRSVIPNVELSYGLTLNANNGTGSATSQSYTIDVSVDPGQAGRCAGAVCSGTDTRTITITY